MVRDIIDREIQLKQTIDELNINLRKSSANCVYEVLIKEQENEKYKEKHQNLRIFKDNDIEIKSQNSKEEDSAVSSLCADFDNIKLKILFWELMNLLNKEKPRETCYVLKEHISLGLAICYWLI